MSNFPSMVITVPLSLREKQRLQVQVKFFWVVMPCIVVVGYYRFRGQCCLIAASIFRVKLDL